MTSGMTGQAQKAMGKRQTHKPYYQFTQSDAKILEGGCRLDKSQHRCQVAGHVYALPSTALR